VSKHPVIVLLLAGLTACASVPAKPIIELTEQQARGYTYAKNHCAVCHAITANAPSPNPAAPRFDAVVNTKGVTARTLGIFLRDSHSFPGEMAFSIEPGQVDDLTAYMVTLKRADYQPPI
jgi:mono/diheme cytochrome c family protein